jgi:Mlc titration factor MtfA (ptsG expression regulator)
MLSWLRRKFNLTATRTDGLRLADELWLGTLAAYPFLETLDPAARGRLRELSMAFLREKEFHGAAGLAVTDSMALAVAAQACLPLVWLTPAAPPMAALQWYDDFVGIVLHRGEVLARREVTDESGVVHHYREALTGEAMDGGPVMLSWSDVANAGATAEEGYNVVIHEFAHKIDMRDGGSRRLPAFAVRLPRQHQRVAGTHIVAFALAGRIRPIQRSRRGCTAFRWSRGDALDGPVRRAGPKRVFRGGR